MTADPIAVLYDRNDAQRFRETRPSVRTVCFLSPAAAVEISDVAVDRIDGLSRYRDFAHARTIVRREKLHDAWRKAIAPLSLNFAETYILDLAFATLFHGFDRLYQVIGPAGPWLIPDGSNWMTHNDRRTACLALSRHILARYWHMVGNFVSKPPPLGALFRFARSILIFMGRRRKSSWVTTRSDHPLGLEREIGRAHV